MSIGTDKIRNICVMGHGSDGKTSLVESMLYLTKGTDRLGKISDGNTVCDFDPEETRRQISISATPVPVETGGYKFNVIDTPGYFDFAGEIMQALRVADAGLLLCTAKSGIGVGTEKSWKYVCDRKMPRMFYVAKLDEENANFFNAFNALREKFGISVCPIVIPAMDGDKLLGVINIAEKKAYKMDGVKSVEMPIPASMQSQIDDLYGILAENVAETSEELMEKFFGGEEFTKEELYAGIREGMRTLSLAPVFCGCAMTGLGTEQLLSGFADFAPCPTDWRVEHGKDQSGKDIDVKLDPAGPVRLLVFKTLSDQYGKFSFFKVISGKLTSDMSLINARTGSTEKFGHIYCVKGKKNTEVSEISCGDIGAVSKLVDTRTGDTLCAQGSVVELDGIPFAAPCYSMAIAPKVKGGEEKIASGLSRMREEDLTFAFVNNAETHQLVVSGAGDIHVDVLCSRLKNKFGVEVELSPPRVPYREKIKKKVSVEGKHKKQSGGHGQFGRVIIEFEPGDTEDLVFEEKIFGGSVPKNFHPAVEKGLRDCIPHGILAGYPVVGLKATLVDGSYHDVDSSEMAFKIAAGLAYKAGLPLAAPTLLEPIGTLKVYIPDSYMGDIIGDLNKRRGRVMGMNPSEDGGQIVEAEVPMAEMSSYAIDLRSMTQGRGFFTFEFVRYEEAPPMVQQKVIEETKALHAEE